MKLKIDIEINIKTNVGKVQISGTEVPTQEIEFTSYKSESTRGHSSIGDPKIGAIENIPDDEIYHQIIFE